MDVMNSVGFSMMFSEEKWDDPKSEKLDADEESKDNEPSTVEPPVLPAQQPYAKPAIEKQGTV